MKKRLVICMSIFILFFTGCVKAQTARITYLDTAAADAGPADNPENGGSVRIKATIEQLKKHAACAVGYNY